MSEGEDIRPTVGEAGFWVFTAFAVCIILGLWSFMVIGDQRNAREGVLGAALFAMAVFLIVIGIGYNFEGEDAGE